MPSCGLLKLHSSASEDLLIQSEDLAAQLFHILCTPEVVYTFLAARPAPCVYTYTCAIMCCASCSWRHKGAAPHCLRPARQAGRH